MANYLETVLRLRIKIRINKVTPTKISRTTKTIANIEVRKEPPECVAPEATEDEGTVFGKAVEEGIAP